MPEVDHDWDKIIACKNKINLFDRIVLSFVLVTLALATGLMFLSLLNPKYFLCS